MELKSIVTIKECHKIPELVGREAKVIAIADPEAAKYPIQVVLIGEPIIFQTPVGAAQSKGPFGFRADELEVVEPPTDVPDAFKDAFK